MCVIADVEPPGLPGERFMPVGTDPEITLQVTGATPLTVVNVSEYAAPTVASGSGEVVEIAKPPPPPPPPPDAGTNAATSADHAAEDPREPDADAPAVEGNALTPTAI
jgi:hypothetical protein